MADEFVRKEHFDEYALRMGEHFLGVEKSMERGFAHAEKAREQDFVHINQRFDDMNKRFDDLKEAVNDLRSDMREDMRQARNWLFRLYGLVVFGRLRLYRRRCADSVQRTDFQVGVGNRLGARRSRHEYVW